MRETSGMADENKRLAIARERAGYPAASDAAAAMGIPTPTYHAHENGSRGFARAAPRYAAFFRVSLDWLLSGKGDGPSGTDAAPEPPPLSPPSEIGGEAPMISKFDMPLDVPVLGTAVGGSAGDFSLNGETVDYVRRPPVLRSVRHAFAIFYTSDSMYPLFEQGDPVYINPTRPPKIGDYVLIEMQPSHDGSPGPAYIKKLVKRNERVIVVAQFNPPRDDIRLDAAKIKNLWRIVPVKELLGI